MASCAHTQTSTKCLWMLRITNSAQQKNVTHGNLSCNASVTQQNTDSQAHILTHTSRQHEMKNWRFFKLIFSVFKGKVGNVSSIYKNMCARLCTKPRMHYMCPCVRRNIRPSGEHKTQPLWSEVYRTMCHTTMCQEIIISHATGFEKYNGGINSRLSQSCTWHT